MFSKQITEGINYVATQQLSDGSFLSFSSPSPKSFKHAHSSHANFPSILILLCLNGLNSSPQVEKIKKKCAAFLLAQKSKYWSFNYWARNSQEARIMPYPDDLDDTFCALAALYQYDAKLIDGGVMAIIVRLLTTLEQKTGGPYRTWLVPETAEKIWRDVDIAVNSNIAYFLSLQEISLPNIVKLIELHIDKDSIVSSYYPSIYPTIYFISRFYRGRKKEKLAKLLLSQREEDGIWENPLSTALALSSLLNFNIAPGQLDKSIFYLLDQQKKGFWQPYPLYPDPVKNGKTFYAGSTALTTAFCLEALDKYSKAKTKNVSKSQSKEKPEERMVHRYITEYVEKRFANLGDASKKMALSQLQAVLHGNKAKQIPLLPYYFRSSLGQLSRNIPNEFVIQAGSANVFGWLAYTIYDNFFDEEGDPESLGIANIALRELAIIFHDLLPKHQEFQSFFHKLMDTLEEANMWEVVNCRIKTVDETIVFRSFKIPDYGNYEKLAQKSFGHGLGPIAMLFALDYSKTSPEFKNLFSFFQNYLIARQLNDDAHDWEKDLSIGRVNPVGSMLLKSHNLYSSRGKVGIVELREAFWYKTIVDVCQIIKTHIRKAEESLHAISIIEDYSSLEQLLLPLEQAVNKAVKEQEEMLKFLRTYT